MRGKKVRKVLTAAAVFLILVSFSAYSETASVSLSGTMGNILEIVVSPTGANSALNLSGATTVTELLVATVEEKSNNPTGYQVSISSLNSFELLNTGSPHTIAYSLFYNGTQVTTDGQVVSNVTAKPAEIIAKEVRISYTTPNNPKAGTYQDTLTFTMENQ